MEKTIMEKMKEIVKKHRENLRKNDYLKAYRLEIEELLFPKKEEK